MSFYWPLFLAVLGWLTSPALTFSPVNTRCSTRECKFGRNIFHGIDGVELKLMVEWNQNRAKRLSMRVRDAFMHVRSKSPDATEAVVARLQENGERRGRRVRDAFMRVKSKSPDATEDDYAIVARFRENGETRRRRVSDAFKRVKSESPDATEDDYATVARLRDNLERGNKRVSDAFMRVKSESPDATEDDYAIVAHYVRMGKRGGKRMRDAFMRVKSKSPDATDDDYAFVEARMAHLATATAHLLLKYDKDWKANFDKLKKAHENGANIAKLPKNHDMCRWVIEQRKKYWAAVSKGLAMGRRSEPMYAKKISKNSQPLTQEQVDALEALGMEWDPLRANFEEGLAALKKYKEENGSLKGLRKANITLYQWAHRQKSRYLEKRTYVGLPEKDADRLRELGFDIPKQTPDDDHDQ